MIDHGRVVWAGITALLLGSGVAFFLINGETLAQDIEAGDASTEPSGQEPEAGDGCTVRECAQLAVEAAAASQAMMEILVPAGAVMAFALEGCPDGWHPYQPAQGRFIRGIDPQGTIDPDGVRGVGAVQGDSFQTHTHGINTAEGFIPGTKGLAEGVVGHQFGARTGTAVGEQNVLAITLQGPTKEMGNADDPRVTSETRPVNVALLFCIKD